MDELYQLIEKKIQESGYFGEISGHAVYNGISDFIEEKENGNYVFLSKPEEDITFEYGIEVMEEEFNLCYMDITAPEGRFHIDFDS